MVEVNDFNAIRIALASPEQIKSWSYGEVTEPETINYRTLRPEKDGLFCERIFGPTKNFECYCGKYKKIRYRGITCDRCGVTVEHSRVRRTRMGHIELAAPVAHIWFAKGVPSRLALLLDISPRKLERVLYFAQYITVSVDEEAKAEIVKKVKEEIAPQMLEIENILLNTDEASETGNEPAAKDNSALSKREAEKKHDELQKKLALIEDIKLLQLLNENEFQLLEEVARKYGDFFEAGMGAESVLKILKNMNLTDIRQQLNNDVRTSTGQRRKKAYKQLRVVEAFLRSGNKPEWMILTVLPVLPPELRPIVQLDGGRFATSDLNDLYRRVINRNNRLRRLLDLGAPDIIIRNEKRMLQESVDALIDNGRRGRVPAAASTHKLKSLSDMLRGKQGRFRQNLLGKRVDYSGRSVIVCGPELKLHQCGLPKQMALELFKPFVMRRLVEQGFAHNIKSARRQVERARPEVWEILKEVVQERPVMLNRAPTLHRLSIQAFEAVLIDGSAIQIHPLVCSAFNADFDGDQMAIHIPLSKSSIREARERMLSVQNMLLPSCGEPVMTPTLDMVLGLYYLTNIRQRANARMRTFSNFEEAQIAYNLKDIAIDEEIFIKTDNTGVLTIDERGNLKSEDMGNKLKTSIGRTFFNNILPTELLNEMTKAHSHYLVNADKFSNWFLNQTMNKSALKILVAECYHIFANTVTASMLDSFKKLGFEYATKSGTTIAAHDIEVPASKAKLLEEGNEKIAVIENQFNRGLITEDERYDKAIQVWTETTDKIKETVSHSLDRNGGIYMMATSGAKGNIGQITQMAGMRGLMTDPAGRIIDFPIKSSFREGLNVMEYFISTHGARKGLADTALRTSDAGYLTRRLIDVAQDLIIFQEDCESEEGIWITEKPDEKLLAPLYDRIIGRCAAVDINDPNTGELIASRNDDITETIAKRIIEAGIDKVYVRSPLGCHAKRGICQKCYGRDLAMGEIVKPGTAVGIIAAQSIGEPGTQLTLRTFHTGGVVGADITSGLPRVEELFEARVPRGLAIISEIDGVVDIQQTEDIRRIKVTSSESYVDEYIFPMKDINIKDDGTVINNTTGEIVGKVKVGEWIEAGTALLQIGQKTGDDADTTVKSVATTDNIPVARVSGTLLIEEEHIYIQYEEKEEREYIVPSGGHIRVKNGSEIKAGEQITDGSIDPQDILHIMGREAVQHYLVAEVQKVYRSQGVNINDKHIEIIVRQMLRRVRVESPGDTDLLPGDLIDRFEYENKNAKVLAEGGEPATAQTVLLGITRSSLNTSSWLAAASFQETTRVLTEAALWGSTDKLLGLKENVIIGRLIPTQESETPEAPEIAGELSAESLLEGIAPETAENVADMETEERVDTNDKPAESPAEILPDE
jgi:DNA-directed RNA polymerase subunit beta'